MSEQHHLLLYLNVLKAIGHHGDEHVNEDNNGHDMVADEQVFAHGLGVRLHVTVPDRGQRGQAKQRPEQRREAGPETKRKAMAESVSSNGQEPHTRGGQVAVFSAISGDPRFFRSKRSWLRRQAEGK